MTLPTLLVLLVLVRHTTQDCVIDHRVPDNTWEQQLHDYLKDSLAFEPRCNRTQPLDLSIRFTLKYFEFDSESSTFYMYSRVHLAWTHDRLQWEPSEYGGIEETTLFSGLDMWQPTFRVLNAPALDDSSQSYVEPCSVRHTGRVQCVPSFDDLALCPADFSAWPYDRQACSYIIAPDRYGSGDVYNVTLSFGGRVITMLGAEYGAEWMIVDYEQHQNGTDAPLNMTFVLERYGEGMGAMVVHPAVTVTMVTLAALCLDPRRGVRSVLLGFSAACHLHWVSVVHAWAPHSQASVPRLVLYYRGSLVCTVCALAVSLALRRLYVCRRAVPPLLVSERLPPRWLWTVAPRWEGALWADIANLINALCLFVYPLVYLSMYLSFVPQPYGITD